VSQIVWLASYPKSGNTWLRVFLSNYRTDSGQPKDINALDFGAAASDRNYFDSALGIESSDMTEDEIEQCRPEACRYLAERSAVPLYFKTHDAYVFTPSGAPLIPSDVTRGAIYVARNPLDVVVSFAHYLHRSIDEAIQLLALESTSLSGNSDRLETAFRERLLSWSGHVNSWLDQRAVPVHLMRYEDMYFRPIDAFTSVVRFLGWEEDTDRVRRAVGFSSFEVLRQQEQAGGFREKLPKTGSFFRQGQADSWREVLTKEQVARVIVDQGPAMQRLGYLPDS
jgi:aryl sulfotransferase